MGKKTAGGIGMSVVLSCLIILQELMLLEKLHERFELPPTGTICGEALIVMSPTVTGTLALHIAPSEVRLHCNVYVSVTPASPGGATDTEPVRVPVVTVLMLGPLIIAWLA